MPSRPWFSCTALLLLAACNSPPSRPVDADAHASTPAALPRLRCTVVEGRGSATGVGFSWHTGDFVAEPWATDDEAVQACLQGITKRFGDLPRDVTLVVRSIDHSASGVEVPSDPEDRGHTLVFEVCWRSVPTDRYCLIYVQGRTHYSGSTDLGTFEPIADSAERLLTGQEAVARFVEALRAGGVTDAQIAEYEKQAVPRLEYVWSPWHNDSSVPEGVSVLAPNWCVAETMCVDAVTGRVWRND